MLAGSGKVKNQKGRKKGIRRERVREGRRQGRQVEGEGSSWGSRWGHRQQAQVFTCAPAPGRSLFPLFTVVSPCLSRMSLNCGWKARPPPKSMVGR